MQINTVSCSNMAGLIVFGPKAVVKRPYGGGKKENAAIS